MKRLLLGLAAAGLLLVGCDSGDVPADYSDDSYSDLAEKVCRDSIKNQLKDPESAEFSGLDTYWGGNLTWEVTGQVNANNSFGGKVGNQGFTCTAKFTEDDETMRGSATLERG